MKRLFALFYGVNPVDGTHLSRLCRTRHGDVPCGECDIWGLHGDVPRDEWRLSLKHDPVIIQHIAPAVLFDVFVKIEPVHPNVLQVLAVEHTAFFHCTPFKECI